MTLAQLALETEAKDQGRPVEEIRAALRRALDVMRGAVERGMTGDLFSASGLVGGDAAKLRTGPSRSALRYALPRHARSRARGAGGERGDGRDRRRADRGRGGRAAGGAHRSRRRRAGIADDAVVDALAVAGLIGAVVAERASLSGAEGGCQAETGAAAAMAAGAATEMLGGTPSQVGHATALALQGTLGLVCDPLGGLVELPCVFRNATGSAIALTGIELALAGVEFKIPVDEVIDVMGEIGASMDVRYRETAGGGLAATPTGRRLARERLVQIKKK